jgi:hypothetical protein
MMTCWKCWVRPLTCLSYNNPVAAAAAACDDHCACKFYFLGDDDLLEVLGQATDLPFFTKEILLLLLL